MADDMQSAAPCDDDTIEAALETGWRLQVETLTYTRVGGGSWHWHANSPDRGRLFVTVDEVLVGDPKTAAVTTHVRPELEWAYQVPRALAARGMPIARPPIPTATGTVLHALDERWVLSVWPHLDGRATLDGTYARRDDAEAVLALVDALHRVPSDIVRDRPARGETFAVPGTPRLLELVDRPWPGPLVGPHAAAAEAVLHRHADDIHALATRYDELVRRAPSSDQWVLTHGEPHAANVVFTDGGPVLIDWDTAKVAPRERDLWMIAADGFAVGAADDSMLELYRAQWDLGELFDYARRFADPLDDGPEGDAAWDDFAQYVARAAAQT